MAKAKTITGLDPHAPAGDEARIIARARLQEMYDWEQYVDNPYEVKNLHNLRIAAKRLRYTFEVFEDVLPAACKSYVEELTRIQDELGAMHDSDVMIALLRLCLGSAEGGMPYEQALSNVNGQSGKGKVLLQPQLVASILDPHTTPSAEQRYGLEQLLHHQEHTREEQYKAFRQHWQQLQERDFRNEMLNTLNG